MCGISGVISFDSSSYHLPNVIKKMSDSLRHRGPDSEGFLFASRSNLNCAYGDDTTPEIKQSNFAYSPKVNVKQIENTFQIAFGHRRLAIIDLSAAAHQPMCSADKKLWITYNGEIYNYIELREELKAKGYNFSSASDTEVILSAYREWGSNCVDHFNGMWAFVIYDISKNILFGSRDRFGVKPLYYSINSSHFAFASEQKSLLKSGMVKAEMNPAAVFDFFVFSKIEAEEEGMFKGIYELMQAHNFEYNIASKELKKWKYYQLQTNTAFEVFDPKKFEQFTQETQENIINAIRLRLRADVAVGSCLSGGMDSSAIVSIMNKLLGNEGKKLQLFTASFENEKIDEGKWAKIVVDRTYSEWSRTFPTADGLLQDLEKLTYCQDIPIWSTSTYAQYKVMELANSKRVKVILDGQGGDELWAGYPHHQTAFMRELIGAGHLGAAKTLLKSAGNFPSNIIWFTKQALKHGGLSAFPSATLPQIYKYYFKHLQLLHPDFFSAYMHRFEKHFDEQPTTLNGMLQNETTASLLKGYLKCEDRCSMWHSVESRTPFADDVNLVTLAFRTPSVFKIRGTTNKYIFRKAMEGIVPESILTRTDKMGYSTPNSQWISAIHENVKNDFTSSMNDVLNIPFIHKNYTDLFGNSSQADNGQVFKFISFASWRKVFHL